MKKLASIRVSDTKIGDSGDIIVQVGQGHGQVISCPSVAMTVVFLISISIR